MKNYKKIKKYYDKYGSEYDEERIEGYYSFINKIETETVKRYGEDKKTLEIGCGTGIILNEVNKFAKDAWGVDLSNGMLEAAKRKKLKVKQANATLLPFEDELFDVVYSFKVLAHIPEIEKTIAEIHRVTKDNGTVILEFYNPLSLKYIANRLEKSQKKVYIRYDSYSNIKTLLKEKFSIIEIVGARIVTPFSFLLKIPLLNKIIIALEKALSRTFLNRFAGYFSVIARKI
ncbi:MAG: class I SAM-dependent methyltransferase [Patescibacteria group bacterium]|nr:class I SAM-dependent methyltransferase [Patescibacteria group bacterium]